MHSPSKAHTLPPRRPGTGPDKVPPAGRWPTRRALAACAAGLAWAGAVCSLPADAQSLSPAGKPVAAEDSQQTLMIGRAPSSLWNPHGLIVPGGPLAVRNVPDGCEDNGTVASFAAAGGTSNSGINGGCGEPLKMMAGYGSFDVAAVFESIDLAGPRLTVGGSPTGGEANVSYDPTHAYFRTRLSPEQMSLLRPGQYVVTNAGSAGKTGSILTGWAADGSGITVAGWIVLGSHDPAPRAPVPPRNPAVPTVYIGAPTSQFGRNTVCGVENSPTIDNWTCWEMDVVNNTNSRKRVGGISVLGMGPGGFDGDGVSVGSTSGYGGAFRNGVSVANFQTAGVAVTQTPGVGGVGVYVGMNDGLPIAVQNSSTGVNVLTVDSRGTLSRDNPVGKSRILQLVVSGGAGDAHSAALLTSDGTGGPASGGVALVPGSAMRIEANLLGLTPTGDAIAWHAVQIVLVSAKGEATLAGKAMVEPEGGGSGMLPHCPPPRFVVRNAMVFPSIEPCPEAGALAPAYGGDLRVFVQTH